MAPEQARGKVVDRRADVWAFGCVLYEMLAGRRTFASDDVTDTLTAVLRDPPDWNALPAETPAAVRSLLARCLDKDPKQRLRDIGEARVALSGETRATLSSGSALAAAGAVAPAPRAPSRRGRSLIWAAVALLIAAVGGLAALVTYSQRPAAAPQVHKTFVALRPDGSAIRFPALSPDGRKIVYAARSRLWVQALDEWEPRELAGTEGGVRPFWSPASDWIGFFRNEQLLKIPAAGGPVVSIASLPAVQAPLFSSSAVWNEDGTIFLSQAAGPQIYRVPGGGGELKEHYTLPEAAGFDVHDLAPLPGGGLVMAVHRADGVGALAVLAAGNLTILLEASNVAHPQYSPSGHLVFARAAPNAGLWAVPFNAPGRTVTGEPFLIGRGTEPSLAREGTLVFLGAEHAMDRRLAWFTMDGRVGDTIAPPQNWIEGVALAPDGKHLVASADDGLWSYDLAGGARSRLTNGRSDMTPQWVGKTGLTFVRTVNGAPTLFLKRNYAAGEEDVIADNARFPTVTADGRRIVFNLRPPGGSEWQVAWVDVDRPTEVHALGPAHRGARFPAVSPDGRLVAYVSGEIGNDEIFLTRFPSGEGKWQLSTDGGGWVRFTPKGDAVVYRTLGGDLISVPVTLVADVTIGRPRKLFEWGSGWMLFYELAPDGTRGIAAVPVGEANDLSSLSLVQNWHAEFAGR
jgi:Tol biopolymer transport system component